MPTIPKEGIKTGSRWHERLGVYLVGVAIGSVLVGMLLYARSQSTPPDAPSQPQQATPSESSDPNH